MVSHSSVDCNLVRTLIGQTQNNDILLFIIRTDPHATKEETMSAIKWIESFEQGLKQAQEQNKLIFLDFFNPE